MRIWHHFRHLRRHRHVEAISSHSTYGIRLSISPRSSAEFGGGQWSCEGRAGASACPQPVAVTLFYDAFTTWNRRELNGTWQLKKFPAVRFRWKSKFTLGSEATCCHLLPRSEFSLGSPCLLGPPNNNKQRQETISTITSLANSNLLPWHLVSHLPKSQ